MSLTYSNPYTVAQASVNERAGFVRKTYLHLAGAIGAFAVLEAFLLSIPAVSQGAMAILGSSPWAWLFILGIFMAASYIAQSWARDTTSLSKQYAGLGLFIVMEALIFLPLMIYARSVTGDNYLIQKAAVITLGLFAGLSFVAFSSRSDFSFLGGILKLGFFVAFAFIICAIIFGINLGTWFAVIMIALAGGSILYQTGQIIHHYRTEQYVAAALGLFASVAMLFWYVLRLLILLNSQRN